MSATPFKPTRTLGGGQHEVTPDGRNVQAVAPAESVYYPLEVTAGAAAAHTFAEPVRDVRIFAAVAIFVADSVTALATAGDGSRGGRIYVPANTPMTLSWRGDTIAVAAVAAGGAVYLLGAC